MGIQQYREQIYAGVLGKIIGVYLGRPVEGWSYQKIIDTFGDIPYYVHEQCGVPLIVADDDISGTFAFFRALADNGFRKDIDARAFGQTWLNYIIEDKTILWWGGLGRSTEHTAYLNLKRGIPAPQSGSIAQNGRTLAEQIGAQIFIDALAMACPNDPALAAHLIQGAARVSHDGLAVDAACYLGAMEAMAFTERRLDVLMDEGLRYVEDERLKALIADVRDICAKQKDWRTVRVLLDDKYGYERYPGCCHMVPNHAMVLASLLLAGDDFQESIRIASSAAWDTDCNAGNVGCLNGIRLGLAGIDAGADFRTPVADRLLVVTSDGGSVVSDAVLESRAILHAAGAFAGEEPEPIRPRFDFEYPGSVQGFSACPYEGNQAAIMALMNVSLPEGGHGLGIRCRGLGAGVAACVSTPTFLETDKIAKNFSTIASPTLYEGQTLHARFVFDGGETVTVTPYVLYYDLENRVCRASGTCMPLECGKTAVSWTIPPLDGMPVFRVGFRLESNKRFDGTVTLASLDWTGAPQRYAVSGMLMTSIWNTTPSWLLMWASSAKQFQADFKYTVCVSHPEENGAATLGTNDWTDYRVESRLMYSLHRAGGLVLRANGHRRYYAARLCEYNRAEIICRHDETATVLASAPFAYEEDRLYALSFEAVGDSLRFAVDEKMRLTATDDSYHSGGAGFVVDCGTFSADGFSVEALGERNAQ